MKRSLAVFLPVFLLIALSLSAGEKEKKVLKVEGIHCSSCASMISKTVRKIDGVEEAQVSLETGQVTVLFDSTKRPLKDVVAAINRMGYKVAGHDSVHSAPPDSIATKAKE
jgi:Cu+-exporting ATPase